MARWLRKRSEEIIKEMKSEGREGKKERKRTKINNGNGGKIMARLLENT